MARLTPKMVDEIKAERSRVEIPDDRAKGLYLVVQPTGAKAWALRYRAAGKPTKLTLGKYPIMSLADARASAAEAQSQIERGGDPAAEARAAKAEPFPDFNTLETVFRDYEKRKLAAMKAGDTTGRELRRHVISILGDRDIKSIKKRELISIFEDIAISGRVPTANRTRRYMSAFMSWAEDREFVDVNVARGIKDLGEETSRERTLTIDEINIFLRACRDVGHPWGAMARMLLLTGQRLSEVAELPTTEVKRGLSTWYLPAERAKNGTANTIHLSAPVLEILDNAPKVTVKKKKFAYYFSTEIDVPVSGFSYGRNVVADRMNEILSERLGEPAQVDHWTYHDLRRTLATGMERLGIPISVTEAILNHKSGQKSGVAGIYHRHKYLDESRVALDAWAVELARIEALK